MCADRRRPFRLAGSAAALLCAANLAAVGTAAAAPVANSALDGELFFQLLIGESELRRGDNQAAFQRLLDAARRSRDERLFQRAVEVAAGARAADLAIGAARAWRSALPRSPRPCETQVQLFTSLGRLSDAAEPMRCLLEFTPAAERAGVIATLPRLIVRGADPKAAASLVEDALAPYRDGPATRVPALVTVARMRAQANEGGRALALAREAQAADPAAPAPALLALELMPAQAGAEELVTQYLKAPAASNAVRMVYARRLTAQQRLVDAVRVLGEVTRAEPKVAAGWLTLGALQLELQQPREAEQSLRRYVQLAESAAEEAATSTSAAAAKADDDNGNDDERQASARQERAQAYLMLAQAAEQQKNFSGAAEWLERATALGDAASVIGRRASLLARQGKVREARELVKSLPERTPEEGRSKVMTESQVLRDARQWKEAHAVLAAANERYVDDADLLYEQAMMAEKLERIDEMEGVLRRVMQLRPEHQHAYNALGYSLADRNRRLPEARQLVAKALELAPGDPFITDSMAWVEFRMGNRAEALRLLREAYAKRPDTEIAAHLGEVLWADGQREEAKRIWREGRERDAANDVLKETLARLKVQL